MNTKIRFNATIPIIVSTWIFALTALVGLWAAPDRAVAAGRFGLIMLGLLLMMGIAAAAKRDAKTRLGLIGVLCSLAAAGLAAQFLLTVNWAEDGSSRILALRQIGLWIHNLTPQLSQLPHPQKNLTGGILILLIPFGLSSVAWTWVRGRRWLSAITFVALAIALFGLMMTVSRGAWLGFAAGAGAAGYCDWRFGRGRCSPLRWAGDALLLISLLASLVGFWSLVAVPDYGNQFDLLTGYTSTGRAAVWRDALPLIQDYPFTGSGLGNTTMILSSYVFLLHVPFLSHTHNLYLQLAIEQGLPGLIAFLALVIFSLWATIAILGILDESAPRLRFYSLASVAAIVGLLVHGVVEAELYVQQFLPLMFLPFGVVLVLLLSMETMETMETKETTHHVPVRSSRNRRLKNPVLWSFAPILAIAALFLWPGSFAAFQANLGTVSQTRAELAVYEWPDWPIQDELRRSEIIDLSEAIGHYQNALRLDPDNTTAHRRLGQIALSFGDYESAQAHLEKAFAVSPNQRATRQLLGEVYAINGDIEQAVALWRPINIRQSQLQLRYWWHSHIGADHQATLLKQAMSRLAQTK